jgi:hypothetical protein
LWVSGLSADQVCISKDMVSRWVQAKEGPKQSGESVVPRCSPEPAYMAPSSNPFFTLSHLSLQMASLGLQDMNLEFYTPSNALENQNFMVQETDPASLWMSSMFTCAHTQTTSLPLNATSLQTT